MEDNNTVIEAWWKHDGPGCGWLILTCIAWACICDVAASGARYSENIRVEREVTQSYKQGYEDGKACIILQENNKENNNKNEQNRK